MKIILKNMRKKGKEKISKKNFHSSIEENYSLFCILFPFDKIDFSNQLIFPQGFLKSVKEVGLIKIINLSLSTINHCLSLFSEFLNLFFKNILKNFWYLIL